MGLVLAKIDVLADDEAPIHRINLDKKTRYKSVLGGFCTLTLVFSFIFVFFNEYEDVYKMNYPVSQSRKAEDYQLYKTPFTSQ